MDQQVQFNVELMKVRCNECHEALMGIHKMQVLLGIRITKPIGVGRLAMRSFHFSTEKLSFKVDVGWNRYRLEACPQDKPGLVYAGNFIHLDKLEARVYELLGRGF